MNSTKKTVAQLRAEILEEARIESFNQGMATAEAKLSYERRQALIQTAKSASEMAIAQSKLAYAMSKILESLK